MEKVEAIQVFLESEIARVANKIKEYQQHNRQVCCNQQIDCYDDVARLRTYQKVLKFVRGGGEESRRESRRESKRKKEDEK